MVEMELVISAKFKQLLPALSEEEAKQLEENIVNDGRVRDPILYWHHGGKNLVVDGMNRYGIAKRTGTPFRTEPIEFANYDEAELWILNNALGRRNLMKPGEVRKVRGELYNRLKSDKGGDKSIEKHLEIGTKAKGQNVLLLPEPGSNGAAVAVAKKAGVDEKTVRRDGKRLEIIETLAKPIQTAIHEDRLPVTDEQLKALAKLDATKQHEVAREVRTANKPTAKVIDSALEKAGAVVKKRSTTKPNEPTAYKPKNSDSVQDETEKCPNCGCTWWKPVKGGHDCDNCCHPMGEPTGGSDEETEIPLGDLEQKALSADAEKELKKARSALGVLVRYCDAMKLASKAKPHLEALAKIIGK